MTNDVAVVNMARALSATCDVAIKQVTQSVRDIERSAEGQLRDPISADDMTQINAITAAFQEAKDACDTILAPAPQPQPAPAPQVQAAEAPPPVEPEPAPKPPAPQPKAAPEKK